MSGNSNPSINSPASTNHELDTLVGDDAIIAANLLQEFNNRQTRHISVSSSTDSSVQYVPHSPTPSVQELPSPPRFEYASPQRGWDITPQYPLGQLRPSSAWRTTPSPTPRGPSLMASSQRSSVEAPSPTTAS